MLPTESWRLDLDGRYPIYQQIMNHFFRSIVKGELCPGERIPSIRELSIALKVNTNTVQRAYQDMEREKLIYSQRGTGYFVMENEHIVAHIKKTMVAGAIQSFLEEMRALGFGDTEILRQLEQEMKKGGRSIDSDDN